ncbi:hypothetical protein AURDEDRAFT_79056 [Auricularia subglabra TFB-10046 SS5]|nr:hypothetical protein AURDEDRAFT_79056 [Auricularia subglabra TFB-10046 SS5]
MSSSKRPLADAGSDDQGTSKKARVEPAELARAPNGQPRNVTLPLNIAVPPKAAGALRIASWNVCGLSAAFKKGFRAYFPKEDADIWVLTETKVNAPSLDPLLGKYPHRYFSISDKKGYSGTAILSRVKPLGASYTLPGHRDVASTRGRIVTLEFEGFWLVGTYVVNAGEKLKSMDAKREWNRALGEHLKRLDESKPVIWAGDMNCAPTSNDLANAEDRWNKRAGYTKIECDAFKQILNGSGSKNKLVDVWREKHPDLQHYTFWDYRHEARRKGAGWRIDMFILSERIQDWAQTCEIRDEIWGASDHCPIVLDLQLPEVQTGGSAV